MTEFDERSAMEADVEALIAFADGRQRDDDELFDRLHAIVKRLEPGTTRVCKTRYLSDRFPAGAGRLGYEGLGAPMFQLGLCTTWHTFGATAPARQQLG